MGWVRILLLLVVVVMPNLSFADDAAVQKYRNFLPEELAALPENVRKADVPVMYLNAANTYLSPTGRDLAALWLNRLLYPGIGDYDGAVRAYQRDLGEKADGKLTVWQIFQLYYRSEMQGVTEIRLYDGFLSGMDENSAFVRGTMTILDEKSAFPVNYQRLNCVKSNGYCRLDDVSIKFPQEMDWVHSLSVLWSDTLFYRITNWTSDTITAVHEGGPDACRTTTLDLNFSTKEFFTITKNLEKECDVLGVKLERLKKPRISQIVDGSDIISAEYNALREKQRSFLSSDFLARFEKAGKTDLQE